MDFGKFARSRIQWALFWSLYFVLFVQQWYNLLTQKTIAQAVIGIVLLSLPAVIIRSAEELTARQRGISAQFATVLALTCVLLFILIGLADAPLTFFLDPDAAKKTLAPIDSHHHVPASLLYAVVKVYSVFDVMTVVGTVATLVLVGIASLIPEETLQIKEREATAREAHDTAKAFFTEAYRLIDIDPASNLYQNLIARQNTLWTSLLFLTRNSPSQNELEKIGEQLMGDARDSSDGQGRHATRSATRIKLMNLERKVGALVRVL